MTTEEIERRWSSLPSDLLLIIFKKLPVEDLMAGAPLCCSSWYKASREPCILKHGQLDLAFVQHHPYRLKTKVIDFVLHHSQACLTSIKFTPNDHAVDLLLYLAMSSPILKNFYLEDNSVERDERIEKVKKFSLAISKLRELEGMTINKDLICFFTLEQIRNYCPNLTTLEVIDEKTWIVNYVVSKLVPNVKVLGNSQKDLGGSNVDESSILTLIPNNAACVLRFWFQCMLEVV